MLPAQYLLESLYNSHFRLNLLNKLEKVLKYAVFSHTL